MIEPVLSPIESKDSAALSALPYSHGIPLPVVDEVLRMGGSKDRGELRIAAHFIEGAGGDAAFLSREYGKGGLSFTVDGKEYTAWFDRDGLILSPGISLEIHSCLPITWQQAADRTRELLYAGEYLPQAILTRALINERLETAAAIYHLYEAGASLPFMDTMDMQGGFAESVKDIAVKLSDEQFLLESIKGLQSLTERESHGKPGNIEDALSGMGNTGKTSRTDNTNRTGNAEHDFLHLTPQEIITRLTDYSAFLRASPPTKTLAIASIHPEMAAKKPSIMGELQKKQQAVKQRGALTGNLKPPVSHDLSKRSSLAL